MPAKFTLRPGVFFTWIDAGISPIAISTSIGALVFPADRGSLAPQTLTGYNKFVDRYGPNNYQRGYGHDTAKAFFRTAEAALGLRVTGTGAKYAANVVVNNYLSGTVTTANPSGLYYDGTTITAIPAGSDVDYTLINRDIVDLIFSKPIVADQSFAVTVNGTTLTAVPYSGDSHYATMAAIAAALQAQLDVLGAGGTVAVIQRVNTAGEPLILRIISPQNINLTVTAPIWSGSASSTAPIVTIRDAEWLHISVTENPGAWGNDVAMQFDGLDKGRFAKSSLTFSGPLAANHRFTVTINGVTVTVPVNATGSNAMLEDIATAIKTTVPNVTASVTQVTGSNLNRVIVISGVNNTVDLNITAYAVGFASGTTPALPSVSKVDIVTRQVPSQDFSLSLYEYPDLRNPKEVYRASYAQRLDATGTQVNLEYLINKGPGRSSRIRIYTNPLAVQNNWTIQSSTTIDYSTGAGFMRGGVNGALPTSADIINGWSKMRDTTRYTVRILMDCGYATPEVHRYMNGLCEERRDCVAIFGVPAQYQASTDTIVNYRTEILAIDSSYSTLYSTDVEIYDTDNGIYRYSPPSGYVGAVYAYTDRTRREFWSPAGLTRGRIPEASAVRITHENGDQGTLAQYQVNAIINYRLQGIYIFNDYTLQYATSPLQFIGTRRMCNSIEIIATNTVVYSLFEPNNKATRTAVIRQSEAILQDYLDAGGLAKFDVYDETTNADIDARQAKFVYLIEPVTSIHQIYITGLVTRAGGNFEEIIKSRSQGNGLGAGQ